MPNVYQIIKYPLVTEKATALEKDNKYLFAVEKRANKHQIKFAIERIYKVTVTGIAVINVRPKKRRYMRSEGYRSGYKKAVVTLKEGEKIAAT